jgi:hypothetical protein
MVKWRVTVVGAFILGLTLALGCGRQSTVSPVASNGIPPSSEDQLPFEQAAQRTGITPTSSVIPPGANVPAGTPITVRLQSTISSATERAGDRFEAVLDEPIIVNGETLAEKGTAVTGRIMEARPASHSTSPGYLRFALTSIRIRNQATRVQTSTGFVKGARGEGVKAASSGTSRVRAGSLMSAAVGNSAALGTAPDADERSIGALTSKDVTVGSERRLTFRLTEPIPLHPQDQILPPASARGSDSTLKP